MNLRKNRIFGAVALGAPAVIALFQTGCNADDKVIQDAAAKQHAQMTQMGNNKAPGGPPAQTRGRADMSTSLDAAGKAGPAAGSSPSPH